jgi:uncharacterized repeat protein (TIGR03803 family)
LTAQFTSLFSFNGSNGANPYAELITDADGNLFGTTESGGLNGYGAVFEIQNTGTLAAPVYAGGPTMLVSFNNSDGELPYAGLIADAFCPIQRPGMDGLGGECVRRANLELYTPTNNIITQTNPGSASIIKISCGAPPSKRASSF